MNIPNLIPYFFVFKMSFVKMLTYRMRYYTGILTYFLYVSVNYYIWKAAFSGDNSKQINGFTLSEMSTYIVIGWILRSFSYSSIDDEIDSMVSTGQITNYLIRPVNFQFYMLASAVGEATFRIFMFSLPIAITLLLFFPIQQSASGWNYFYVFVSAILGFLIFAAINFLIGLLSFYLASIRGVMRAKYFLIQLCSGLLLPLSFFPKYLENILYFLPFQAISYIPLQIYLGKVKSMEIYFSLGLQVLWIALLLLMGQYFWKTTLKNLTVNGG